MNGRAYIARLSGGASLRRSIQDALDYIGWDSGIHRTDKIFIKPNLTWKSPLPGVTVTPAFLEAFLEAVRERSDRVTIGESNGGYHGFQAEEAFESHGLYEVCKRLDVKLLNLSKLETRSVEGNVNGRAIASNLPRLLLEEIDTFVTVPVPKVHANTGVSIALKNQWGCLPDVMRLRRHHEFADLITFVNQALRVRYAVCDGTYMLDKNGPMIGTPVRMDVIIAANPPAGASMVGCQVMGIDPWGIRHHRTAQKAGLFPNRPEEISINADPKDFRAHPFTLELHLTNRVSKAAFHSRFLTRAVYDSSFADMLHKILYSVRRQPLIARVLYGSSGAPEVMGHR